jgi:hypothetical protein
MPGQFYPPAPPLNQKDAPILQKHLRSINKDDKMVRKSIKFLFLAQKSHFSYKISFCLFLYYRKMHPPFWQIHWTLKMHPNLMIYMQMSKSGKILVIFQIIQISFLFS